jgi:hypothetical protein
MKRRFEPAVRLEWRKKRFMADLVGDLWACNFQRVVVFDASSDVELARDPLPATCYPVIGETFVRRTDFMDWLASPDWISGYLYQRFESPSNEAVWVGVVRSELASGEWDA